jgi:hypothetical protein
MAEETQVEAPIETPPGDPAEVASEGAEDAAQAAGAQAPDDADDLRGFHFRRLLRKRLTWILIGIFGVGAAVGLAFVSPVLSPVGALAVALLGLLVVFIIADSAAEDTFFDVYASGRGMTNGGRGMLPAATPLLRKGDDRYGERILTGPMADDVDGTLSLYTYETEYTDSEGHRQTNYYRYTLGLVEVPECSKLVPELFCRRKFGLRALEKFEDAFRSVERVKLESEALDERYEIFAGKEQDANWLRQLFSPTFIVWLSDTAPEKFVFELVDGTLCCYVSGHKKSASDLDAMRAASASVTRRLREEALE